LHREWQLDNLSHPQYHWTLTTTPSPAVDALWSLAKSRLPVPLEVKFAEFPAALIETHGKDLTVSVDSSRSGTPAPSTLASGAASVSEIPPVPPPPTPLSKNVVPEKNRINTSVVTVEATFMADAAGLFELLTDEKKIPLWTRAPATVGVCVPSNTNLT
jgi:activator of HSP90 ATPase